MSLIPFQVSRNARFQPSPSRSVTANSPSRLSVSYATLPNCLSSAPTISAYLLLVMMLIRLAPIFLASSASASLLPENRSTMNAPVSTPALITAFTSVPEYITRNRSSLKARACCSRSSTLPVPIPMLAMSPNAWPMFLTMSQVLSPLATAELVIELVTISQAAETMPQVPFTTPVVTGPQNSATASMVNSM